MVGVVRGVTPDRWVRAWRERMPAPLQVVAIGDDEAAQALLEAVDLVFARLPMPGIDADDLHAIPLWDETPVVVAARDHPVKVFESVTLEDLADEDLHPGWDDATLDIVAAGHGIARMPQSVLRATGRRDLVGRPITDAEPTRIALVWLRSTGGPLVDEFIGIVRGRTSNSSRSAVPPEPPAGGPTRKSSQQAGRGRRPTGGRTASRARRKPR